MRYLEDVNVDGRILLKWILNRAGRYELDQSSSGQGQVAHSCEMSCESSVLLKDEELLDYLSNNWLFKKVIVFAVCYCCRTQRYGLFNRNF